MPRGLNNWSYKDVIEFLKEKGFRFSKYKDGSHEVWVKRIKGREDEIAVDVNLIHGGDSYPLGTLKSMIRQSEIGKSIWRK